ncbi:plastocyanin/azurin family copper-binding protein [Candidatus Parcubacteria bacterium]|nr:plastocyanin/azurin family copper-binding protein [Candidatus Parcubacteria bacterium]
MQNPIVWAIIVIVLVGAGWFVFQTPATAPLGETPLEGTPPVSDTPEIELPSEEPQPAPSAPVDESQPVSLVTVTYTVNGFSPSSLTVKKGTMVTFVNQSGRTMWVASDEHPSHSQYDGTSRGDHCPNNGTVFDQCASGDTYAFTFNKTGSWGYHNHTSAGHQGTIMVTE